MNLSEVWGAMGGSTGLTGPTSPSTSPLNTTPGLLPPQPTAPTYLGLQIPATSSSASVTYPPVSRPSLVSTWGIGGFATPPLPTPPPVVCPNTIASTMGIPQMPSATYFNSRAPMGCNIRMAGSTLNGIPFVYKRKQEDEPEEVKPAAKQHITEERMAAHLNSLHLSETYYNHRLGKKKSQPTPLVSLSDVDDDDDGSSSESGGDEGLGGEGRGLGEWGARVVLSKEVKQAMVSEESALPSSLLNKLRKPSMEVVLWQPPGNPLQHVLSPPPVISDPQSLSSAPSSTSSSPDSGISVSSTPPPPGFLGGASGLSSSSSVLSDISEELLSLPSTSSGARGGFIPPPRRPASPLPDPMVDDDLSERMEFNNNNNGAVPNFMWLEENNNTALIDLNAVEPPPPPPPQPLQPAPDPFLSLPDLPDSDDMDL